MAFMQSMFEAYAKGQKKASKSEQCKRRVYESSDSSDSEQETGYCDTGFSVDKHLKIDKPLGTVYSSTEPHPIKVAATALSETTRADEIAIETAKTSKVTAVVAVMSILVKKRCNLRSTKSRNEKPSRQKEESAHFPEENSRGQQNHSPRTRKGGYKRNQHLN